MQFEHSQRTHVLLHADDLGMNRCVTDGIIAGFSHGLLTSTSVLANAPDFERAIVQWLALEGERTAGRLASAAQRNLLEDHCDVPFDLGIHLNLTQGRPLTTTFPAELLDREGRFPGIGRLFQRLAFGAGRWRQAIYQELSAQIERVIDRSLHPTHLNGHQYVELVPGVAELIPKLVEQFQIGAVRVARERRVMTAFQGSPRPFSNGGLALVKHWFAGRFQRRMDQRGIHHADVFCGTAHAGRVSFDVMRRFVVGLPRGQTIEIGLHPGIDPTPTDAQEFADGWSDPLADVRPQELAMIQSPDVANLLASESLCCSRINTLFPQKHFGLFRRNAQAST